MSNNWPTKKLGEVLDYEQPTTYIVNSTDYKDSYATPVLTAGKSFIKGYTKESDGIFPAEKLPVIIFDDFTTASKLVNFQFKVKSSAMKILLPSDDVDIRYAFYFMQTIDHDHRTHKRYWISEYSKREISLPPLKVQKQIVKMLEEKLEKVKEVIRLRQDSIADTEKILSAKLNEIFAEGKEKGWKVKTFEEVLDFKTGKLDSNAKVLGGKYPFFTCAQETFAIDSYSYNQKAVLLAGNNAAGVYSVKYYSGKFDAYQRTYIITPKDENQMSYLYLKNYLHHILNDLKNKSVGANTKFLTMRILNRIEVPLPNLETQEKIVRELNELSTRVAELRAMQEAQLTDLKSLERTYLKETFSSELS